MARKFWAKIDSINADTSHPLNNREIGSGTATDYLKFWCEHHERDSPFIICFTEHRDALSQWRGYADDARGFAIGFRTQFLRTHQSFESVLPANKTVLAPVIYEEKEQDNLLNNILGTLENLKCDDQKAAIMTIANVSHDFAYYNARSKNPAFNEEKEWRLICRPHKIGNPPSEPSWSLIVVNLGEEQIHRPEFRLRNNTIIRYFNLALKPDSIAEVGIGSRNTTPQDIVNLLLQQNAFAKVNVYKSDATYQ